MGNSSNNGERKDKKTDSTDCTLRVQTKRERPTLEVEIGSE